MTTAKELMGEIIAKLNTAGFTGGFYFFKEGECSCCFGRTDKDFFEVNENIPENWGIHGSNAFYYKINFKIDDKAKATEFRKIANKLSRKYFGKLAETATSNYKAIIIYVK